MSFDFLEIVWINCKCGHGFLAAVIPEPVKCPDCGAMDTIDR